MSKEYHQRPSQFLGLDDPYPAWCLDEAVYRFGTALETKMNEAENSVKDLEAKKMARLAVAREMLDLPDDAFENVPPPGGVEFGPDTPSEGRSVPSGGRFADPAAAFGGTTKVGSQGRPKDA
jgi:hypothetical protein